VTSQADSEGARTLDAETQRVRRIMDRIAPGYDRQMRTSERLLFGNGREWVCSQAHGAVLEIAVGTGRNLPYYPAGVTLTGIDLSPAMLDLARARAQQLGREVDLRLGDAQSLTFPDESFDTVVCTLALCSIPDDGQAVRAARRVLRAGGQFLYLEHVRSPVWAVRAVQRIWDVFSVRLEGDHLLREPLDQLKAAGFEILTLERSKLGIVERGVARKPQ
jgi:ubiquinone/menaquinone biosynthesis C-methylase UbiE